MNSKQVIHLLKKDGWSLKVQKGSHGQYIHPTKKGKVTVPIHGKDEIPPKTLKSILNQAGLK
jgi:predicted RNA binding protein YcfA (HicA-like mRNA interferase family)